MYVLGNHNYSGEEYQTDFNYPQEWLDESEMIDKWIFDNEKKIILFLQNILRMDMQINQQFPFIKQRTIKIK